MSREEPITFLSCETQIIITHVQIKYRQYEIQREKNNTYILSTTRKF